MTLLPKESEHTKVVERRAVQDAQTPEGLKSSPAVLEDSQLPLEQKKRKILRNLRNLEQAGIVTISNKYQDVINDISKVHKQLFIHIVGCMPPMLHVLLGLFGFWMCKVHRQDIRYQRRYRQRRKAELVKLQQTLTALNSKTAFYQDQMNYYDTYIKTCLDNLNRKWVVHFYFTLCEWRVFQNISFRCVNNNLTSCYLCCVMVWWIQFCDFNLCIVSCVQEFTQIYKTGQQRWK